eukprot:1831050-Prymnesium_polylepis.2
MVGGRAGVGGWGRVEVWVGRGLGLVVRVSERIEVGVGDCGPSLREWWQGLGCTRVHGACGAARGWWAAAEFWIGPSLRVARHAWRVARGLAPIRKGESAAAPGCS